RVIRAVEDEIERFSRETASPVAVAEGDVRLRSDRKFRRLGVSGFTTAAPPNAAFGSCYEIESMRRSSKYALSFEGPRHSSG
ncbi:hypothetical protein ACI7MX_21440, partial [Pseudomonas sp. 2024-210]|uniref:hypothetical protein n=1 Tax=Pseudomonas sp. 2024-210 TaxID=3378862 RepID=UPI00385A6D43